MTDALTLALDQLVDRLDGAEGNWHDVIRRAQPAPALPSESRQLPAVEQRPTSNRGQRRPRRRLIVVGIALLVASIALAATPAFGLRDALRDLIGGEPVRFGQAESAPKVVKYQFEDLAVAAPPSMNPQVIPGQTRKVGELRQAGRKRALYVAPARNGGFCYFLAGSYGGCLRTSKGFLPPLTTTVMAGNDKSGTWRVKSVGGNVLSDTTATVTVEFADGSTVNVPFLYVLSPIDAGFFAYDVPFDRQTGGRRPIAVVSRDKDGKEIWRQRMPGIDRPGQEHLVPQRPLPMKAPVELTAPIRKAEASGAVVSVGHNGAAEFDLTHLHESRVRLLRKVTIGYGCFSLVIREGRPYARGYNSTSPFRRHAGIPNRSVGPIDGCELQAGVGHRWPDRFDSHSAVEFPLTDAGRRYFEDRAAARDLALLVRSKDVQKIRALPPTEAVAALKARYGKLITPLAKAADKPPPGMIGYVATDDSLVLVRMSTTGKRFEVVVKDGKIVGPRLKPWAMVF